MGSSEDQNEVLYNLACALALLAASASPSPLPPSEFEAHCQEVLTALKQLGALEKQDLLTDEDFSPLRERHWFRDLLNSLP